MPCENNAVVAGALAERYGQPQWRFTNSGTETTMPAVRAARAFTGRERVVKPEGSYHGHYDWILGSNTPLPGRARPAQGSAGVPNAYLELTTMVPFNDLDALEHELLGQDVACFILEPALTNVGMVMPEPGYLAGARQLCDSTGTVLIFDEVKIGITAAWGGATAFFGVRPDMLCVSKSIGGGIPLGAFGGRAEIMEHLRPGGVTHAGTFSGNPLAMAASRAVLLDICTPDTTHATIARASRLGEQVVDVIAKYDLPAHVVQLGARGGVAWIERPIRTFADTLDVHIPLAEAQWLYGMNRGVLMPPSLDCEWLVSVQHTDADVDETVGVFADFAAALTS
jgi:glutamate-1-semialdehyde 2,1-aminomutase